MSTTDPHIEQLRAEAAAHRQSIATDLELMGDRVSPSRIAERRKARLRERVHGVRNTVFGTADQYRTAGPYGNPAGGGATPPSYGEPTGGQWQDDGGDSSSMTDRASGALQSVKDAAPDSLGAVTEGNPLAAAVVGFGIGMLAASLLPSSPDERRAANKLQGHLEDVGAEVGRTGKQAVENVKPEAQQAVQDLKESAQDSVQSVKSDAQSKADEVKGAVQSKADEVKGTAQDKAQEVRSQA